jgi:hypothetical protein
MKDMIINQPDNPGEGKMIWTNPELKELHLANTLSGDIHPTEIGTTAGPAS